MFRKISWANSNIFLLLFVILLISSSFLIHNNIHVRILNSLFFSAILLFASASIKRTKPRLIYFAIGVIVLREISAYLVDSNYFDSLATILNVIFFLTIVFQLIHQVARSKEVDRNVILEAINGYLLMGLSGSILFALVDRIQETAFSYTHSSVLVFSDYIYFGFITQTTIGFGDITPVSDLAKLITIGMGICGQLYIAIVIAMLVGKYLTQRTQ